MSRWSHPLSQWRERRVDRFVIRLLGHELAAKRLREDRPVEDGKLLRCGGCGPRDVRHLRDRFSLLSVGDAIDTRTAAGRLVLNVLTSVAQWEREAGAERTREALGHLRREGVRLGAPALGWRRSDDRDAEGRRVVIELDEERAVVDRICALRGEGRSLAEIAATLEREGHPTKRGGRWAKSTVLRIARRAAMVDAGAPSS